MKNKTYFLVLVLNLLIWVDGKACFCIPDKIETADLASYEELFLGKVLNIERIGVGKVYEGSAYDLVGTITTFEVIKKWRGSDVKVVRVFQEQNSCSINFTIANSRWIVSANTKSFVSSHFKQKYPGKYLQTDNCALVIEELDYKAFEDDIEKIDTKIPVSVEMREEASYLRWVLLFAITLVGLIVVLARRLKLGYKD